ncbi:MAG: thioredoxin family protein [Chitinophagales bacterium]
MKKILNASAIVLCFVLFSACTGAKKSTVSFNDKEINWLNFEQVAKLNQEAPRKVIVEVYTDWCGWCKKMDKTTFQHPKIIKYINQNYYAVRFNGEIKETVKLNDKQYKFVEVPDKRGYNELAYEFLDGKMNYPSLVFLDEKLELIQNIAGFQKAPTLDVILNYFASNSHTKTPWKAYEASFQSKILEE